MFTYLKERCLELRSFRSCQTACKCELRGLPKPGPTFKISTAHSTCEFSRRRALYIKIDNDGSYVLVETLPLFCSGDFCLSRGHLKWLVRNYPGHRGQSQRLRCQPWNPIFYLVIKTVFWPLIDPGFNLFTPSNINLTYRAKIITVLTWHPTENIL